jgi:hypothetical protein
MMSFVDPDTDDSSGGGGTDGLGLGGESKESKRAEGASDSSRDWWSICRRMCCTGGDEDTRVSTAHRCTNGEHLGSSTHARFGSAPRCRAGDSTVYLYQLTAAKNRCVPSHRCGALTGWRCSVFPASASSARRAEPRDQRASRVAESLSKQLVRMGSWHEHLDWHCGFFHAHPVEAVAMARLQQPRPRHLELFRRFVLLCDSGVPGAGTGAGSGAAIDGPGGDAKLADFMALAAQQWAYLDDADSSQLVSEDESYKACPCTFRVDATQLGTPAACVELTP